MLETINVRITNVPPAIAHSPGYSPKTNHTKIGASTDSNKISNETSGELKNRGPKVSRHVAPAIKILRMVQ